MAEVDINRFKQALNGKKIPLLVLDHKWHHLFRGEEKTEEIIEYEKMVNEYLQEQGGLNQKIKDLKKVKSTLMQNIVNNMEGPEDEGAHVRQSQKMAEDKRLIEEVNEKIAQAEDELLDLPHLLQEANANLMILSMAYIYNRLHANAVESKEIGDWITKIRVELKKKIIRKQFCDIKNKEMYQYMNAILGAEVLDVFDIQYDESFELKKQEDQS